MWKLYASLLVLCIGVPAIVCLEVDKMAVLPFSPLAMYTTYVD